MGSVEIGSNQEIVIPLFQNGQKNVDYTAEALPPSPAEFRKEEVRRHPFKRAGVIVARGAIVLALLGGGGYAVEQTTGIGKDFFSNHNPADAPWSWVGDPKDPKPTHPPGVTPNS